MDGIPDAPITQGFNVTTTNSTAVTFLDTGLPLFSDEHFQVACTSAETLRFGRKEIDLADKGNTPRPMITKKLWKYFKHT